MPTPIVDIPDGNTTPLTSSENGQTFTLAAGASSTVTGAPVLNIVNLDVTFDNAGNASTTGGTVVSVASTGEAAITNTGEISGDLNGVNFVNGGLSSGSLTNDGTIESDSRAVNIGGSDVTVTNNGDIIGTGNQRNGTIYSDGTADDFSITNSLTGTIDAGVGNDGAGIALQTGSVAGDIITANVTNAGDINGRGQAAATGGTAGDGVRIFAGTNSPTFSGDIENSGSITSESLVGATSAVRVANGVNFVGTINNTADGLIDGANNGLYFGTGDHDATVLTAGTIQSDSRAVNIDGSGVTLENSGDILGTGNQRNGTIYADATADDYSITNTATGTIDAGVGNNGSGVSLQTGEVAGDSVTASVTNAGDILGRGDAETGNTVGDGVRVFSGFSDVSFNGGIVNTGTIQASTDSDVATGISIEDGITLNGTINNSGIISANEVAIDTTEAGSGVSVINTGEIQGLVNLSSFDDTFDGSGGSTSVTVNGGAGNDIIAGGGGTDILDGGDGIDTNSFEGIGLDVVANLEDGTASYGSVNETFVNFESFAGSANNDTLTGDAGDNVLSGNAGNDTLIGGDGDDIIAGGGGTDIIDGGAGIDTNSFAGIGLGVEATLNADGTGTADYGNVNETFTGIENLTGSDNNDTLIATGAAANTISGGDGDDFIAGGGGTDILDGGAGIDTNSFQGIGFDVVANLEEGTASYGPVNETFVNFENLDGSANNDTLTGDAGANILTGNDGDDILVGGDGDDVLDGGAGIDTADFSDVDGPVVVDLDADGNGTATRETGFSVEVSDAVVDNPAQFGSMIADGAAFVQEAVAGNLYFNIHTADFPGGEIRGQLFVLSDETNADGVRTINLAGPLDAAQEPDPISDSEATGEGTVTIVVAADGTVTYSSSLDVTGLVESDLLTPFPGDVSAIHLHNAPAGENGPVVQDLIVDAGATVATTDEVTAGAASGVVGEDVIENTVETDTLISIENVILEPEAQVIEGAIAGAPDFFDGQTFIDLDDGDQFVFNGPAPFSTDAIAVDGQNVTVPGATFTVDGNLDEGNFLAATNDGVNTTVEFVDELLGDGLDLIEGQAVAASEIDGISFAEFVGGNGSDTDGTDFTVTLDNSTSGFENSFGVFVFDTASGAVSDVQIVADNAQNGGSLVVSDVAAGEQLGFFIVQDGAGDSFDFTGSTLTDLSAASGSEVFQSIDASANSDGLEHFLSGSVDGGGALRVGVEDLTDLGDSDFQDVVFTVTRDENFDDLAIA